MYMALIILNEFHFFIASTSKISSNKMILMYLRTFQSKKQFIFNFNDHNVPKLDNIP